MDVLADGDYFGDRELVRPGSTWSYGVQALTSCTVFALPRHAFEDVGACPTRCGRTSNGSERRLNVHRTNAAKPRST